MRKFILDPAHWILLLVGIGAIILSLGVAFAGENKLQSQALSMTGQLNGNCSATLISSVRDNESGDVKTVFLTAKHCVDNDKADMFIDMPVYQKGRVVKKDRYIARLLGKYFNADLALVVLKDKQTFFAKTAKIAPVDGIPSMGDQVWTVGYPLGLQLTVTAGLFGSLETIDYPTIGVEYFRATPDVVGGSSGGAMYRTNATGDYELIGVTSAGHRAFTFVAFYTPLEVIHNYLKVALPETVK
ncbi:MAG: trypsin-like peptidase domain-containing protein [Rhizobiaceae bacterium]|nr:trypsin-like peptidase domain-containing protein [Rhizobiaceae bacterium]